MSALDKKQVDADGQWFCGIEHMTRQPDGRILWKGCEVEYFTSRHAADEKSAATALAARCLLAEGKGFPVCFRSVNEFSPLIGAPADTPWQEAMMKHLTLFEDGGRAKWLGLAFGQGMASAVAVIDGALQIRYALDAAGPHTLYLGMRSIGLTSNVRRLEKYESFVHAMEEAGINPGLVHEAIEVTLRKIAEINELKVCKNKEAVS